MRETCTWGSFAPHPPKIILQLHFLGCFCKYRHGKQNPTFFHLLPRFCGCDETVGDETSHSGLWRVQAAGVGAGRRKAVSAGEVGWLVLQRRLCERGEVLLLVPSVRPSRHASQYWLQPPLEHWVAKVPPVAPVGSKCRCQGLLGALREEHPKNHALADVTLIFHHWALINTLILLSEVIFKRVYANAAVI